MNTRTTAHIESLHLQVLGRAVRGQSDILCSIHRITLVSDGKGEVDIGIALQAYRAGRAADDRELTGIELTKGQL